MANHKKSLLDFQALIAIKEKELLLQREAVWKFVDAEHDVRKTEEYRALVRKTAIDVSEIMRSLMEIQDTATDFKIEAEKLCQRCKGFETYTRDMEKSLTDDLAKQHRIQDKGSVDVVRNVGIFFGIMGFFIAAQKAEVAKGAWDVNQAAEIAGVVGALTLSHKKIKKAFLEVGKAICNAPSQIKNSFTVYYVCETIKQTSNAVIATFKSEAKAISAKSSKAATVVRKALRLRKNDETPKF